MSYKFQDSGFTLIELIVTIAIMGIAFSIFVSQYAIYRNAKALSLGEEQVVNDIKIIRNYALGTIRANSDFPKGGYGIRFLIDSDGYTIFADADEDHKYSNTGEKFEEIKLPQNVKVTFLRVNGVITDPVDLVFAPPYGIVYIDSYNKKDNDFVNLEITISNSSNYKTIKVRSSGLIE